jgi:hypothetical protein
MYSRLMTLMKEADGNSEHFGKKPVNPHLKASLFDEYSISLPSFSTSFRELKKQKDMLSDCQLGYMNPVPELIGAPQGPELEKPQVIIDTLVLKRFEEEDYSFIHITSMNYFEQFHIYKDNRVLYSLRMKLWYFYM